VDEACRTFDPAGERTEGDVLWFAQSRERAEVFNLLMDALRNETANRS
jgi:hypothetical protein